MRRIGILTYHDLTNYGAQLQATATQRFLQANGYDCEIIDFRPIRREIRLYKPIVKLIAKFKISQAQAQRAKRSWFRGTIFDTARISKKSTMRESGVEAIAADYDVLICGSDELWNFTNYLGYCGPYILDFSDAVKARRISYAASVGSFVPSGVLADRMQKSLQKFDAIMVRDFQTQKIVTSFGLHAERVLDPTFISELPSVTAPATGYMMMTGGMSADIVKIAVEAARILGLEIKCVGYSYPGLEHASVNASPAEWVGYIQSAACHFTTLFHGAALSIKYDIPFAAFVPESKKQKMEALLQILGCPERAVSADILPGGLAAVLTAQLSAQTKELRLELTRQSQAALLRAVAP